MPTLIATTILACTQMSAATAVARTLLAAWTQLHATTTPMLIAIQTTLVCTSTSAATAVARTLLVAWTKLHATTTLTLTAIQTTLACTQAVWTLMRATTMPTPLVTTTCVSTDVSIHGAT
jgi:hypothetical protein